MSARCLIGHARPAKIRQKQQKSHCLSLDRSQQTALPHLDILVNHTLDLLNLLCQSRTTIFQTSCTAITPFTPFGEAIAECSDILTQSPLIAAHDPLGQTCQDLKPLTRFKRPTTTTVSQRPQPETYMLWLPCRNHPLSTRSQLPCHRQPQVQNITATRLDQEYSSPEASKTEDSDVGVDQSIRLSVRRGTSLRFWRLLEFLFAKG